MAANPHSAAYATLVAPLIPVFLLAAVTTTSRVEATEAGKRRALIHVVLMAGMVGVALLAEFVALFGVRHGALTSRDTVALDLLLVVLAVGTITLVVLPHIERYVSIARVPELRIWRIFATIVATTFVGCLVLVAVLESP